MMIKLLAAWLVLLSPLPATAQPAAPPATVQPITIESYYRIKWGSAEEFDKLYERNHAPLLRELQKAGQIVAMKIDRPFTHMAGGVRWDLRVTITYRDAAAAMDVNPPGQAIWKAAKARLYPDVAKFDAEEMRRFSLLEEHWDVVIG